MRQTAIKVEPRPKLHVGDKVRLAASKRRWTVRGVTRAGRFVILTQPFNLRRSVLYTVIDFDRGVRGRDNYYGLGYESEKQIAEAVHLFQHTEDEDPPEVTNACDYRALPCLGRTEVSFRDGNHVRLDITEVNGEETLWTGSTSTSTFAPPEDSA